MNFIPHLQDEDNECKLHLLLFELESFILMSDQIPQRNARRGAPPEDSMNTSNITQSNPSSEASHAALRPNTRSQAPLAGTAGIVDHDRAHTETHQGPAHASTQSHSNTTRAHPQLRNEEERHGDSYTTQSSKRPARDQQYQEDSLRASTSRAHDKASGYYTRESSNTRRNLRKRIQMLQIAMGQIGN